MSLIDGNTFSFKRLLNRYRIVRSYASGSARNPALPVELILEITDHCNLACPMCPRPNMTRALGHMSMELFQRIIDQVRGHIELVYISGGLGEPLMHPRLGEMIRYATDRGVRVGLSTNATLLWPKMTGLILDNPPHLMLLSLDGATKKTHESIRVGSNFEKTMANVDHFLREKARRKQKNPRTVVQMIYMPENQHEAEAFRRRWKPYVGLDDIRLKKFLNLQGADRTPEDDREDHRELSCILPWRQLSIAYDGTLALCCRDLNFKDSMGSVATRPIAELWNSDKMVRYRELLATKRKCDIGICSGCPTVKTTPLTRAGSVLFDDLSIRKLLPWVEKLAIHVGIDLAEY